MARDGRDATSSFPDIVKQVCGDNIDPNDEVYRSLEQTYNNACEAGSDIERAYRFQGKVEGLKTETRFEELKRAL